MAQFSFKNISKVYFGENTPAVNNVSLELEEGEVVGVIGPSGSGKSTLIKLIGGFIPSDEGEFFYENKNLPPVEDLLIPGFEGVKYLRQDFKLDPNDTVGRRLKFALRHYDEDFAEERYTELIELTQLGGFENKLCKLLSGGQRQRLALAVSIAEFPELLLMDEPFSQLDRGNKLRLINALRDYLSENNISSVIVTHHPEELFGLADRIIVLREGQIIQEGSSNEVYFNPNHKITAELFGPVNWFPNGAEKNYGWRWEDTFLYSSSKDGLKEATVKDLSFAGKTNLYTLKMDESILHAYSEKKFANGQIVWVDFDKSKKLNVRI
ncbi:ABC transporter ATP-binding protein [Mangrovivirga sp. M17]|uniref:ABC transporter ATP-binding protein n=1 Tax=Mangrovivirga halotolerans TaxID=2993936 RepID=A0ABT3RUG9_9BACT|nr:ABC transporter ATP-binding protein [Mangrovivirga halotolerans]MCX2744999.1 ABC transporter ATP-binding protein [Mangrovivirga halotolerans]